MFPPRRHIGETQSQEAGAKEPSSATGVLVSDRFPLTCCFRIAEGLNTITRRGEIGTSTPVFGFRPRRCPFFLMMNDPNDASLIASPFARVSVIS
jgi:hypothetical protein